MDELLDAISNLKHTHVSSQIRRCMDEFRAKKHAPKDALFSELCFCILTANYHAEGAIRIQADVGAGFVELSENELSKKLKSLGYRFPNTRARYIVDARKHIQYLAKRVPYSVHDIELRAWLVGHILGLGYKEASHFLRNVGYRNLAIIDFHIIDLLVRHKLIEKPKTKSLGRMKYLEIEQVLAEVAKQSDLSLGELDLYLWYLETGSILK